MSFPNNMKGKYSAHKFRAAHRGIDFLLTFEEWCDIWLSSGKYQLRGKGKGKYNMCRINDTGPYAVGNVFIGLHEDNARDGHLGKPLSPSHIKSISKPKSAQGRLNMSKGWEKRRDKEFLKVIANKNAARNLEQVTCNVCYKQGGKTAMQRWHFNNCKELKNA